MRLSVNLSLFFLFFSGSHSSRSCFHWATAALSVEKLNAKDTGELSRCLLFVAVKITSGRPQTVDILCDHIMLLRVQSECIDRAIDLEANKKR